MCIRDRPCTGVVDQNGNDPTTNLKGTACDFEALLTLVQRLINFALYGAEFIAVFLIIYAGFLYLTAGGDPSKPKKAKEIDVYKRQHGKSYSREILEIHHRFFCEIRKSSMMRSIW